MIKKIPRSGINKLCWLRPFVDLAMLILFIAIMHPRYTGMGNHARMAYALCSIIGVHLLLNWRFFAAWGRGPWTRRRIILAVLDVALLVSMAISMVSVKLIPKHTGFYPSGIPNGFMQVHVIAGWLCIFLVAVHLGMHGTALTGRLPKQRIMRKILSLIWKLAALAGVAGAVHINLWTRAQGLYPLLKAPVLDPIGYYMAVVFILILISTVTHYLVKRL